MDFLKKLNPVLLIVLICIISRIPILISPDLRLDSDECLVGLMAKHLMLGKDFSIYFWGQIYGITIVEELFIIPFYVLLGVNALAVKLGMLTLWTLGVVFFYKTLIQIRADKRDALFITILLIAAPSWALWSMKARGGYLTAFTLSSIVLYLVYHPKLSKKYITYTVAGLLLFIIYESQKFWYSGLVPLVLYKVVKDKSYLRLLATAVVYLIINVFVNDYKTTLNVAYQVDPIELTKDNIIAQITRIPEFLYTHMHGKYHFSWPQQPNIFSAVFAFAASAFIFILLINAVVLVAKREKGTLFYLCAVIFIPVTFFYSMLTAEMQYRYWLPVSGYTLIALYIMLEKYPLPRLVRANITGLMVVGFIGIASFWQSQCLRSDREGLNKIVKYFEDNDIHHVYSADYTFQWDVMFLTNERVLARFFKEPGRHPAYDFEVDKALMAGKKTAVFGNADRRFGEKFDHYELEDVYYISVNPTKESLQQIFEFRDIPKQYQ